MLLIGTAGAGTFAYLYVTIDLPEAPPLAQTTSLYDRDGNLLAQFHGEQDRTAIPFSRMPDSLRHAVLSAEDARFYSHPGISVFDIARAAWADLTGGEIQQGASTITQQLVRNAFPGVGTERTITRKAKEAILALKLERELEKNEIFERYLNTVYLGHGAYGAQAAAKTYFGKDAEELTVLESATLAGVISRPAAFDPVQNPQDSEVRRDWVLGRMAALGYISEPRAARLQERPVHTVRPAEGWEGDPEAYFIDYTRRWLQRQDEIGTQGTFAGGLKVTTTIDPEWQRAAFQAIWNHYPITDSRDVALVAIDPSNGAIRAIASKVPYELDHEHALACLERAREDDVTAPSSCQGLDPATFGTDQPGGGTGRQTGSAFKMFTLTAALDQGISLSSTFSGRSPVLFDEPPCGSELYPWDPENYGGSQYGAMDLTSATANSVNTIFAQLIAEVGPDKVQEMAYKLGIVPAHSHVPPFCAITLGAAEVNVLEMTNSFATLASGGIRHNPTPVASIRGPDRELIWRNRGNGRRVIDENVAWQAVYAMERVVSGGTGTAAYLPGVPTFGKTGTEDDQSDAWFCGGTTELVACVWIGHRGAQLDTECTGGTCMAPIWRDFMAAVFEDVTAGDFPTPEFTGEKVTGEGAFPTPSPTPSPKPDDGKEEEEEEPPPTTPPPTTPPPTTPPPTTPPPPSPPPTPEPRRRR